MNQWTLLAFTSLALAAIPCGLFLSNLFVYRRIRGGSRRQSAHFASTELKTTPTDAGCHQVSVLIPARNEEASIRAALASVLANRDVDLEVLVLDDHSTDRTAEIVRELAARDARVRLIAGAPLPPGWCGKQFACHTLAQDARHPLLVFMDADVRLNTEALRQMGVFVAARNVGLASGVPRQLTGTFLERLLIPLIHFVLLGFLPMIAMRRSLKEKFAAGCGQLFIARRDAYFAAGGHEAIRASLHDGVKLPRAFRRAGFRTDLFDATDLARCRMYQTNAETWRGLGKNATEGLGAPGVLPVMSALLLGGQVLPFLLLAALPWLPANAVQPTLAAALCAWIPRLIAARRFRQSLLGAMLHPLGVTLLLAIQWQARWRQRTGVPMSWKGRNYAGAAGALAATAPRPSRKFAPQTVLLPLLAMVFAFAPGGARAEELKACAPFSLTDQYRQTNTVAFPRAKPLVLLVADKEGSAQINPWIAALKERFGAQVDYGGVADVRTVPGLLHGRVRSSFSEKFTHPVMLDWSGAVFDQLGGVRTRTTLVVVGTNGFIQGRFTDNVSVESRATVGAAVEKSLRSGAISTAANKKP